MSSDESRPLPKDIENLIIKHWLTLNRYGDMGIYSEHVEKNSASYRFLKKLERKRLAAKCSIKIDMRGKQPNATFAVWHEDKVHELDRKSHKIFKEKLEEFDGVYTQGVYEAVMNGEHTYKQVQQQEDQARLKAMKENAHKGFEGIISSEPDDYDDLPSERFFIHKKDLLQFGCLVIRKESRLMYVMPVELTQPGKSPVMGKSKDISVSGMYVTVDADEFACKKGQTITVRLVKLEAELKSDELVSIFRILNVEEVDDTLHLRLQRVDEASSDDYVPMVTKFVSDNVRRYKADFQDVIEQTAARIYEHNYCQNFLDLPVIVSKTQNEYVTEATLVNELNKDLLHHLTHGASAETNNLSTLISHTLRQVFSKSNLMHAESLVGTYMYTNKDGETELFLASDRQYANSDEQKKFLAVGKHCNKFKMYKLLMTRLTDEQITKAGKLLEQMSDYEPVEMQEADDFVERCQFMVVIQDVTASMKQKLVPTVALSDKQLEMATAAFNRFVHKPSENLIPMNLAIGYKPCRKEPRYLYELDLVVSDEVKGYRGSTLDFSVHGLGVILDEPCNYKIGELVTVGLPSLAERANDDTLLKLEYVVKGRSMNRRELYLYQKPPSKGEHRAKEFFQMLIKKNQDKLVPCPKEDLLYFQTKMSQIFLVDNLLSMPFFLGKEKKKFTLNSLGYNANFNDMLTGFEVEPDLYEIPFLMNPQNVEFLIEGAKKSEKLNKACFQTVMFSYMDESKIYQVKFLDKDFPNAKVLSQFIVDNKKQKNFHVLLLKIKAVIPFNKAEFDSDFSKVRVHSVNRYKKLVEEIDSLHYVGELIRIDELFL